jgi:hypothetical protein
MADHDQRFKVLLHEFFAEFFQLFFPKWAERFDFAHVEWLDKEVFTDPPQGEKLVLDVVAQLPTRQAVAAQRTEEAESWVALIHVEVESRDSVVPLRSRMHSYYEEVRQRHRKPVLPIALYLRVGLDGVGVDVYEEYFWEFRILRFEYLYAGLPALDAQTYVSGDNWLGVALAALMRIPDERKAWLKAEALRRLVQCPENDYRRFLLGECIDAYLQLTQPQQQNFEEILATEPYQGVRPMYSTMYEEVMQTKILPPIRGMIQRQLETRFGELSSQVKERLQSYSVDQLVQVGDNLLDVQSLKELGLED